MNKAFLALALGTFGIGMTEYSMMGLLPFLADDFGITVTQAGHFISAYALGVCTGAPLVALLLRKKPLKSILYILVSIMIFSTLSMTICPASLKGYYLMMFIRFIGGLPHGAYFSLATIIANRLAPAGKSTFAISMIISGMTIANLVGIPVGTFLSNLYSWRLVFGTACLCDLLAMGAILKWMPYLEPLPDHGLRNTLEFARHPAPWLILVATIMGNCAIFAWYSYVSPTLTLLSGVPLSWLSVMMVLCGAGMFAGNLLGGKLADRFGPGHTGRGIDLAMCLFLLLIALTAQWKWCQIPLLFLTCASLFAVSPPQQNLLFRFSKGGELFGGAFVQIAFSLGNALGAWLGGLPIDESVPTTFHYPPLIGAAAALIGVAAYSIFCHRYEKPSFKGAKAVCVVALLLFGGAAAAQTPVKDLQSGPRTFLVNPYLEGESDSPYIFSSLKEALSKVEDGTAEEPMTVYLMPGVHWLDDPDDPQIRRSDNGTMPYGVEVSCNHLNLIGLDENKDNVVVAVNRGQMAGAEGNFTMMHLTGNDITCRNITFGNYCNVDLIFPYDTLQNRPMRTSSITQSQLIVCNSDRVYCENCAFISRLNACPFSGSRRALFSRCHIACGDDALPGSAIFLGCTMDFYSSKPFYSTYGTGAVFLDCDFRIYTSKVQYMTKVGNPVTLIDCRFLHSHPDGTPDDNLRLEWTRYPHPSLRCYQYNITLNGRPVRFNGTNDALAEVTVQLEGKPALAAYKFAFQGIDYYNVYGLTRGGDDWDPLGLKSLTEMASAANHSDYTAVPTMLRIQPNEVVLETAHELQGAKPGTARSSKTVFTGTLLRFGNIPVADSRGAGSHGALSNQWTTTLGHELKLEGNDNSCTLSAQNEGEEPVKGLLQLRHPDGIEGAAVVTVLPRTLPAPSLAGGSAGCSKSLSLKLRKGTAHLSYTLEKQEGRERTDCSVITWYRCADGAGTRDIPVAVSRLDRPEYDYRLTRADVGFFLKAVVEPRNSRSLTGDGISVITAKPIVLADVKERGNDYETDFQSFPTTPQLEIIPGFWTVDAYKPLDTKAYPWAAQPDQGWRYGSAQDGAVGTGLLQLTQGARLLYTPLPVSDGGTEGRDTDMDIVWSVDPCKTASQGFGSATGQYMDLYIKFDTRSLSGYALRIERTPKYANAVDFTLVQYVNGVVTPISESVSATCFLTGCTIHLRAEKGTLTADVTTTTPRTSTDRPATTERASLPHEVHLSAPVSPTPHTGYGLQHTGTVRGGSSATMLHRLSVRYLP